MERLTELVPRTDIYRLKKPCIHWRHVTDQKSLQEAIDKLAEYENKEEQENKENEQ